MTTAPYPTVIPAGPSDPTDVMGRRIGAYLIDSLVPTILAFVVGFIMFFSSGTRIEGAGTDFCERVNGTVFTFDDDPIVDRFRDGYTCLQLDSDAVVVSDDDTRRAFGVGFLIWLLAPLNYFILQGTTGASVGKHLFGLRVVRDEGQIAGFGRNAGRTLMLFVDAWFCALVGLITALVTHPHRRVGDMVAGTYVIGKDRVGTPIPTAGVSAPPTWQAPPPTWTPYQPPGAPAAGPPTWGATPGTASMDEPVAEGREPDEGEAPPDAPPPPPSPANLPPGAEMRWDERWNAWLYWDPNARRWLRHDRTTNQWIPM
jgi:uncharacterized RDD family membrane protein YckC